ncbi:YtxH domain-containing protein [Marinigracilibium pacificum]|uniref:YtxH domain-containing protein n=1 Tax=Marinigracilibium pacificum TaxID=2729599 RepID=A0A848J0P6_9BACT|nr:YtxH domain-containing protein [Marinigracilibium pacificum]NMM49396.1 YtxH domain-containing protein [Marinigracilibium pacificum]
MKTSVTGKFFTLMAGAAIGTTIGFLLAPGKGDDTRRSLLFKAKNIRNNLNALTGNKPTDERRYAESNDPSDNQLLGV